MQEWFEADVVDRFWVSLGVYDHGADELLDGVVPILQNRDLLDQEYDGATLCAHLGAPTLYRVDHRFAP